MKIDRELYMKKGREQKKERIGTEKRIRKSEEKRREKGEKRREEKEVGKNEKGGKKEKGRGIYNTFQSFPPSPNGRSFFSPDHPRSWRNV